MGRQKLTDSKKRSRIKKSRKVAGNRAKLREPETIEKIEVEVCETCDESLKNKAPLMSTSEHIVEDILEPPEEAELVRIILEKKYCNTCQRVNTAKSKRALPGADIGLNAAVLICCLWVFGTARSAYLTLGLILRFGCGAPNAGRNIPGCR